MLTDEIYFREKFVEKFVDSELSRKIVLLSFNDWVHNFALEKSDGRMLFNFLGSFADYIVDILLEEGSDHKRN